MYKSTRCIALTAALLVVSLGAFVSTPVVAQSASLSGLLATASDNALDKLVSR